MEGQVVYGELQERIGTAGGSCCVRLATPAIALSNLRHDMQCTHRCWQHA